MNNNYLLLRIATRIKNCVLIRAILAPLIIGHRKMIKYAFRYSEDYIYLKSLKNSHVGEKCIIVGNGPSLTVGDLEMIQNMYSFASNRIYTLYNKTSWRPNVYMCGDMSLLKECINEIPVIEGTITLFRLNAKKYIVKRNENQHFFVHDGPYSLSKERLTQHRISEDVAESFSISQSITCLMMELAFYMGFKEIYLIGVDHRFPVEIGKNGNKIIRNVDHHFAGDTLSKQMYQNYCYKEALTECYESINKYAKKNMINIFDVTRNGELNVFEKKNFEDINWR